MGLLVAQGASRLRLAMTVNVPPLAVIPVSASRYERGRLPTGLLLFLRNCDRERVMTAPSTERAGVGRIEIKMTSKKISFFMALVSTFFLAAWHDLTQAMPLTRPNTIVVEKMAIEALWRHRHHQLRRQSRQQPNDEHRRSGDEADTHRAKK
jgi:hypothetical protein